MGANLPTEWKAALANIAPTDIVRRVEGLVTRGQTAPLPADKELGPFLLFMIGHSVEEVANTTGIPSDVVYLTAVTYRWLEKREELNKQGPEHLIAALQKQMVNSILVMTQAAIAKQVGEVMSGKVAPDKCPLVPRSLHALQSLLNMATEVNKLVTANSQAPAPNQTVINNPQNVQVVQQVQQAPEKQQTSNLDLLKQLAGEDDGK